MALKDLEVIRTALGLAVAAINDALEDNVNSGEIASELYRPEAKLRNINELFIIDPVGVFKVDDTYLDDAYAGRGAYSTTKNQKIIVIPA